MKQGKYVNEILSSLDSVVFLLCVLWFRVLFDYTSVFPIYEQAFVVNIHKVPAFDNGKLNDPQQEQGGKASNNTWKWIY